VTGFSSDLESQVAPVMSALVLRRKALGLRQSDMAPILGVPQQEVSRLESARHQMGAERIVALLTAYAGAMGATVEVNISIQLREPFETIRLRDFDGMVLLRLPANCWQIRAVAA
jgi:transcriptional regulator with XRE-family HTH domain